MIIDIQQKAQKNKISTIKKKRDIIFQSYNDLKFEIEKEDKENIHINVLNSPNTPIKNSIEKGQIPIVSKNKKIIMFTENRYSKVLQRGKSPFFISDKINFRNEFKSSKLNNEVKKPKHLGLCDFYSKNNKKNIIDEEEDHDFSKTPRFHRELY